MEMSRCEIGRTSHLLILIASVAACAMGQGVRAQSEARQAEVYRDPSAPLAKRVDDLVSRMTLEEKVRQMQHTAPCHSPARCSLLRLVERSVARHRALGICHGVSAGHRNGGHLGRASGAPGGRSHRHRNARQVQPGATRGQPQHLLWAHLVVPQHQHLPRPTLGTRPGDLRRRSLFDVRSWE